MTKMPIQGSFHTAIMLAVVFAIFAGSLSADELTVLSADINGDSPKAMLKNYLRREAEVAFNRRNAAYEALKTPEQIEAYAQTHRDFLWRQVGGQPERTPLNPQEVGKLEGDGFRLEKIIFESRPKHFVTALLYLPISDGPHPGVIVPCGHTANGKTGYQHICILLARNGIAALCYDPIGQGERYQLLDENGKRRFRSTDEHTLLGVGSMLVGRNTASYRVWDGIRALDYLASREEVDETRLGCTGNSGGGTLTEYLMALDDRIACAAPSCCITSFERKLDTIGPGAAEQNIHGQIAFGLDHAEYVIMRAPKPTLLCAATHDFVDIQGAWDIFRESKRVYTRFGYAERVDLIEVDGKHGFSQPKREAAVRWMRRWLLKEDDAIVESPYTAFAEKDILCTPRGQAQLLDGAVSVIDLNAARAKKLAEARERIWQVSPDAALVKVRNLTGIRSLADLPRRDAKHVGEVNRDGYTIEKLILHSDEGIQLPSLLFRPEKRNGRQVLYLHEAGKQLAEQDARVERARQEGATVLAVDLRGVGETGPRPGNMWGGDWDDIFVAYLLGKSMLGMRTEDALVAARYLQAESERQQPVEIIAHGSLGPVALHAAALEKGLVGKVTLIDSLTSWMDVVASDSPGGQLVNAVHGALTVYDLTDLAASLSEGSVTYVDQQ